MPSPLEYAHLLNSPNQGHILVMHRYTFFHELQVSKIRPSDSDYRKFYIDTGTVELRLKADTRCIFLSCLRRLQRNYSTACTWL